MCLRLVDSRQDSEATAKDVHLLRSCLLLNNILAFPLGYRELLTFHVQLPVILEAAGGSLEKLTTVPGITACLSENTYVLDV